jgi:DNA-binding MarR family transcriptional regulator
MMATDTLSRFEECSCLAVRQAARHVTQFYDQRLAPFGRRTTQFSILAKLKQLGPMTINRLAVEMVMDRTTLGRNILPLEREGLISVVPGRADRRSKELRLTDAGIERYRPRAWVGARRKRDSRPPSAMSAPSGCALCSGSFGDRSSRGIRHDWLTPAIRDDQPGAVQSNR